MKLEELSLMFPSRNVITGNALLVTSSDLWRLKGKLITDCHMFLLICSGSIEAKIDGIHYILSNNTYVDMFEKTSFLIESIHGNFDAYAILPTQDFVLESLKSFRGGNDQYLMECLKFPVFRITQEETDTLKQQMQLLTNTFFTLNHRYRLGLALVYFKSLQMELGNIILNRADKIDENNDMFSRKDSISIDFMRLVWRYYIEQREISFYADKLNISTKHLTRIIKETIGFTPHDFIAEELMHQAVSMLETHEYTIQQIATQLNFSDQASFSKFFKKHKKITPTEYRQQLNFSE